MSVLAEVLASNEACAESFGGKRDLALLPALGDSGFYDVKSGRLIEVPAAR